MGDPLARFFFTTPGLLIRLVGLPIRQQARPDKPDRQPNLPSIFMRACEHRDSQTAVPPPTNAQ